MIIRYATAANNHIHLFAGGPNFNANGALAQFLPWVGCDWLKDVLLTQFKTFIHNIENTRHVNYVGSCGMLWPTKSSVSMGLLIDPKVLRGNSCDFKYPRGEKFSPGLIAPPPRVEGESCWQPTTSCSSFKFRWTFPSHKRNCKQNCFPSSIIFLSHPQSVLIKWLPMLPLRGVISDCASEILFYLPIKPRPLWVIPIRNKGHQDEASYFHLNARARASLI